jgi:ferredoxin
MGFLRIDHNRFTGAQNVPFTPHFDRSFPRLHVERLGSLVRVRLVQTGAGRHAGDVDGETPRLDTFVHQKPLHASGLPHRKTHAREYTSGSGPMESPQRVTGPGIGQAVSGAGTGGRGTDRENDRVASGHVAAEAAENEDRSVRIDMDKCEFCRCCTEVCKTLAIALQGLLAQKGRFLRG